MITSDVNNAHTPGDTIIADHTASTFKNDLLRLLIRDASQAKQQPRKMGHALETFLIEPDPLPIAPVGVPIATCMTPKEFADAISADKDPWATDQDGAAFPTPEDLPVEALLTTIELLTLFNSLDDIEQVLAPSALTTFVVPDPMQLTRLTDQTSTVLNAINQLQQLQDVAYNDAHIIFSQTASIRSNNGRNPAAREGFALDVERAIAAGQTTLIICDSLRRINDVSKIALDDCINWPPLTAAMIIQLLGHTHSATGQVAEGAITGILPDDASIAGIPTTLICHAFRAQSSIAVAKRLASYAKIEGAKLDALTLTDVRGLPAVCARMREIIIDLEDWKDGRVKWADINASALLFGPPGTGKTMLAEALAGSANIPFYPTSFTDLQAAGHLGNSLAAMSEIVRAAIDNAPSVIFFDELDSYGRRGGSASSKHRSYMVAVINDLLQQLTQLNAAEGVIVLAATNYLENIDPAIQRSGRFDLKIPIGHPDKAGVHDILSKHVGDGVPISNNIVDHLLGRSGADLANVARDAKSRARRERVALSAKHLAGAVAAVSNERPQSDLYRIAIHEAGHVTMAACLGLPLPRSARITHAGGEVVRVAPRIYTKESTQLELAYHLGGRAAEQLVLGEISSGSGGSTASDLDQATELALEQEQNWGLGLDNLLYTPITKAKRYKLSDSKQRILNERLKTAETLAIRTLSQNEDMLRSVAEALNTDRELDAQHIEQLCSSHVPPVPNQHET